MSTEDNADVLVLPPVVFVLAIGAGFALRRLVPVRLVPPFLEGPAGDAGAALAVLGLAFGGWAFATFVRAKTTPHPNHPVNALVTWGPYRVSRNPMYVGLSVFTAGLALVANTPWLFAVLPPAWLALRRLVIDREEAYLERRFGDEYRTFLARTRRWL
ncbi:MAG TPA: isoprenylcysteine carboxylmethyltransferase family protein [Thermoanaerobaculia bacterium]|nr:isoprenylcysteine carboxylmethyltransferase family protein [Thermoanaerobaculia bacterium]